MTDVAGVLTFLSSIADRDVRHNPRMATSNPYDRRSAIHDNWIVGRHIDQMSQRVFSGPPGLHIEDLEAMAGSAFRRGQQDVSQHAIEREQNARRQAWDEGHQAAAGIERGQLLSLLDRQFGERIREMVQSNGLVLYGDEARDLTAKEQTAGPA